MNKIDFAIVISAYHCNPNGDPLDSNRPRMDYNGYGWISDVCLKRKIRNRLYDMGKNILLVSNDHPTDGGYSIKSRLDMQKSLNEYAKKKDPVGYTREACKIWIDVRSFGQVFPLKIPGMGLTQSVRGPISIGCAISLSTVDILDIGIAQSTNLTNDSIEKDTNTLGMKYMIDKAAYVSYGSIYPQLAEVTGFSDEDIEIIKNAMATILENDASSSRPSGSMESRLYWWEHETKIGKASPATVHRSLNIRATDEWPFYETEPENIPGIKLTVY